MKVRNIATTMVAGLATLASASVLAFDFDGIYVLGGVGVAGVNDSKFSDSGDGEYFDGTVVPLTEARTDFAWRGGLGFWMTDNIALEANYIGLSSHTDDKGGLELESKSLNFWDLTGLGRCFIADQFWVFGRAGVAYADKTTTLTSTDGTFAHEDDNGGLGASVGVGAQYDFTPMIGLRVEASTIQALNDNDMYAVTGNLVINFGELM
jgi:opacity protein-like surface antigen